MRAEDLCGYAIEQGKRSYGVGGAEVMYHVWRSLGIAVSDARLLP